MIHRRKEGEAFRTGLNVGFSRSSGFQLALLLPFPRGDRFIAYFRGRPFHADGWRRRPFNLYAHVYTPEQEQAAVG
jgi:hypothetical protein